MSKLHIVKLGDIALVGNYVFWLSLGSGFLLDRLLNGEEKLTDTRDEEDTKHVRKTVARRVQMFLMVFVQVACVAILAYYVRNIVQKIPYPLDGVAGFQHSKLKELNGGVLIAFALLLYGGSGIKRNIVAIFS